MLKPSHRSAREALMLPLPLPGSFLSLLSPVRMYEGPRGRHGATLRTSAILAAQTQMHVAYSVHCWALAENRGAFSGGLPSPQALKEEGNGACLLSLSLYENPLCARHCVSGRVRSTRCPLGTSLHCCSALTVLQEVTVTWAEKRDGGVRAREQRQG